MTEFKNEEKARRKKQRAILNTIREACIYQSKVMISDGDKTIYVEAIELKEEEFRDLDEERLLITKRESKSSVNTECTLKIEDNGEVCSSSPASR